MDMDNVPDPPAVVNLPTVTRGLTEDQLEAIAASVNLDFKRTAAHIIAIGRKLEKAQRAAGYGQWERLFMDHPRPVRNPVPCTARYGRQYVAIAKHPVLTRPEHSSDLPHTVRTLVALSKLDPATVARGFEDQQIRPDMQTHDVRLLKEEEPLPTPEERAKQRDKRARGRIRDLLRRLWRKYPKHRGYLLNQVHGLESEEPVPVDDFEEEDER